MKTIGEKLTPILVDIENTLLDYEAYVATQPKYSDDAIRAVTKIFASVVLDKMFSLQDKENLSMEDRCAMSTSCGNEISKLIKTYTNLDTHKFYK